MFGHSGYIDRVYIIYPWLEGNIYVSTTVIYVYVYVYIGQNRRIFGISLQYVMLGGLYHTRLLHNCSFPS